VLGRERCRPSSRRRVSSLSPPSRGRARRGRRALIAAADDAEPVVPERSEASGRAGRAAGLVPTSCSVSAGPGPDVPCAVCGCTAVGVNDCRRPALRPQALWLRGSAFRRPLPHPRRSAHMLAGPAAHTTVAAFSRVVVPLIAETDACKWACFAHQPSVLASHIAKPDGGQH
jgi:hypothetical protein